MILKRITPSQTLAPGATLALAQAHDLVYRNRNDDQHCEFGCVICDDRVGRIFVWWMNHPEEYR